MTDGTFGATMMREDAFAFSVRFDRDAIPTLTVDESAPLGNDRGPSPTRMLATAIAHCLSASLLFCLGKSRVDVVKMGATVTGTLVRNEAGCLRIGPIDVTLTPGIAPEDRDRISRCLEIFEEFCVVTGSVRRGLDVNVAVKPAVVDT